MEVINVTEFDIDLGNNIPILTITKLKELKRIQFRVLDIEKKTFNPKFGEQLCLKISWTQSGKRYALAYLPLRSGIAQAIKDWVLLNNTKIFSDKEYFLEYIGQEEIKVNNVIYNRAMFKFEKIE